MASDPPLRYPFPYLVASELRAARKGNLPMNSWHEAYAVIWEEVEEFWEEVRKKRKDRNGLVLLGELVQVAAMCQRAAEDLGLTERVKAHD